MFAKIEKTKDHPIWADPDARAALANAALFAATAYSSEKKDVKTLQLFKAVASYARQQLNCGAYEELIASGEYKSVCEKFRRYINHETEVMQDSVFLDCLASFLLRPKGAPSLDAGHPHPVRLKKNGDVIWRRFTRSISGLYDIQRAVSAFQAGSFDNSPNVYSKYDPGADLNRIAEVFFNVTKEGFRRAALSLTGREEVTEKASWREKGYWSCYRLSGRNVGEVVKTRLIITPPEPGFQYCRFENISEQSVEGNRDARGLVLPVGRKLYFIGAFNSDGIGAKVIYLTEPKPNALVTSGLVMSTGFENNQSIVSRIVAKREVAAQVVAEVGDRYHFARDDLGHFPMDNEDENYVVSTEDSRKEISQIRNYIRRNILNVDETLPLGLDEAAWNHLRRAIGEANHG